MIKAVKALLPSALYKKLSATKRRMEIKRQAVAALRPTDVFLVGHPKSGNTWVAFMLAVILSEKAGGKVTTANVCEFVPNLHVRGVKVKDFSHFPSPRIFRNENPVWRDFYPKTIYLVRDPRAVLLSYYHHWLHAEQDSHGTLEEFVDEILKHGCIRRWERWLVRWDVQVDEWLARAKSQPVHIVRYEDLVRDRREQFREIVDFAGLDCPESLFSLGVERGAFGNMQKSEKKHGAEAFPGETGEKGYFVRKGQVDSWREEMPENVSMKIEEKFSATMKVLGYI